MEKADLDFYTNYLLIPSVKLLPLHWFALGITRELQ